MKRALAGYLCCFVLLPGLLLGTRPESCLGAPGVVVPANQESPPAEPDAEEQGAPAGGPGAGAGSGSQDTLQTAEPGTPQAAKPESEDEDPLADVAEAARRARENPLLRRYFLRIFTAQDPFGVPSVLNPDDPFTQDFVDRQIDAFVFDLHKRLEELHSLGDVGIRLLERWERSPGASSKGVVAALIGTLEQMRKASDGVADRLSLVLVEMERKFQEANAVRRELEQSDGAAIEVARRQLELIRADLAEGNRLVRDYFFSKSNVVRLEDLAGANMLQRFDAVEARAKALAEFLKARAD